MEKLLRAAEGLRRTESQVEEKVNIAKEAGEVINAEVNQWLKEAHNMSSYVKSNWTVDDTAASTQTDRIKKLVDQGKSILSVYFPDADPEGIELVKHADFLNFRSRVSAFDTIMKGLKKEVGIIGVFGMGGIGKTKSVVELGEKVKDMKLFDKVLFATVTRKPNVREIQGTFADMLKLEFKDDTESERAEKLRARIEKQPKVLLILDDVWGKLDLNSIGIPSNSKGCKILITARDEKVCTEDMGCRLVVPLGIIEEDEAWYLFVKHARLHRRVDLHSKAKEIVSQCKGVPLAVVTVGSALRGRSSKEYEDAARRLSKTRIAEIESVDGQNIYKCLKLSYDYLDDDKETQKCFLLCCLFAEGSNIRVEVLTRYAYGMGLFPDVESIDQSRQKIVASVQTLVKACLLSLGTDQSHHLPIDFVDPKFLNVKMHDLVRDVALSITKEDGFMYLAPTSLKELKRMDIYQKTIGISLDYQYSDGQFLSKLECPELKILRMHIGFAALLLAATFGETTSLRVLDLLVDKPKIGQSHVELASPVSLQYVHNLKTLHLCVDDLRDIDTIGDLINLEIISLVFRNKLKILPGWMKKLRNLRLLDLSECYYLEKIPRNLLSGLTKLEELYTPRYNWGRWSNAFLSDLKLLPCLNVFAGAFKTIDDADFTFDREQLKRYYITSLFSQTVDEPRLSRTLMIKGLNKSTFKVFEQLFPAVESLKIQELVLNIENLCPGIDGAGFQSLRKLDISNCECLKSLIKTTRTEQMPQPASIFPNLVHLELRSMLELRTMCDGPPPLSYLGKLRHVSISRCPNLESIVPNMVPVETQVEQLEITSCDRLKYVYQTEASTFPHIQSTKLKMDKQELSDDTNDVKLCTMTFEAKISSLKNLTRIKICNCLALEEVFPLLELDQYGMQFSNLVELELENLPRLNCIWKGALSYWSFHKLRRIQINKCRSLKSLFTSTLAKSLQSLQYLKVLNCGSLETIIVGDGHDEFLRSPLPSNSDTSFREIMEIHIHSCEKLKSILPVTFFRDGLSKLESISIKHCPELEQVFEDDKQNVAEAGEIKMNNLWSLRLLKLPKLLRFTPLNFNLILPSLSRLKLDSVIPTQRLEMEKEDSEIHLAENQGIVQRILRQAFSLRAYQPYPNRKPIDVSIDLVEVVDEDRHQPVSLFIASQHLINLPPSRMQIEVALTRNIQQPESTYFSELQKIEIDNCDELTSLFTTSMIRALPKLHAVKIRKCDNLEHVFDDESFEGNASVVSRNAGHIIAATDEYHFQRLEDIQIEECSRLIKIFPVSMAHVLSCLQSLSIEYCEKLERVFYDDSRAGKGAEKLQVIDLPAIKFLHLTSVPRLLGLTPEGCRVNFLDLRSLDVVVDNHFLDCGLDSHTCYDCDCEYEKELLMTDNQLIDGYGHPIKGLLPITAGQSLADLETLSILNRKVNGIEELFNVEEIEQPVLRSLTKLLIHDMHHLKYISKGPAKCIDLWNLREIEIYRCWELKNIFNASDDSDYYTSFPQLERLRIVKCRNLKSIFYVRSRSALTKLKRIEVIECSKLEHVFCDEMGLMLNMKEIQLPALKVIELARLPSLMSIAPANYRVFCPSLKEVQLFHRESLEYLHIEKNTQQEESGTLQRQLRNKCDEILPLKNHDVKCIKMANFLAEEVFDLELNQNEHYREPLLYKLKYLELSWFPNLKCVWEGCTGFITLWSLERISITNCRTLKTSLFTGDMTLSLKSLKIIEVINCKELEHIFEPHMKESIASSSLYTCLQLLEIINIEGCGELKSIFSISIAQCLPKLRVLRIKGAPRLEHLFIEDQKRNVENKVIELPQLRKITLEELPCFSSIIPAGYVLHCRFLNQMTMIAEDSEENCKTETLFNVERKLLLKNAVPRISRMLSLKSLSTMIDPSVIHRIRFDGCRSTLHSLFTRQMIFSLTLKIIEVFNFKELEHIFEPGLVPNYANTFGHIDDISYLDSYMLDLKKINVEGCDKLKSLFLLSLGQKFRELEEVRIKRAPLLEQLFTEDREVFIKNEEFTEDGGECNEDEKELIEDEGESTDEGELTHEGELTDEGECNEDEKDFTEDEEDFLEDERKIWTPMLKTIQLEELPCLSRICPTGYALSRQTTRMDMKVIDCPLLEIPHDTSMRRRLIADQMVLILVLLCSFYSLLIKDQSLI